MFNKTIIAVLVAAGFSGCGDNLPPIEYCGPAVVDTVTSCPGRPDEVRCVGFDRVEVSGCWVKGLSEPGKAYVAYCTEDTTGCGR